MKKEDFVSNEEYIEERITQIKKDELYFYELDPQGDDVEFSNSILPVRPYSHLRCCQIAIINHAGAKIRIKLQDDIEKTKRSLIKAAVLMKFSLTIEKNCTDFLRNYQISYKPKLLMESTSWSTRYIESDYRFNITTGAEIGDGELKLSDVNNKVIHIFGLLHSQIIKALFDIQKKWPLERYKELLDELQQIGLSNNSQHL